MTSQSADPFVEEASPMVENFVDRNGQQDGGFFIISISFSFSGVGVRVQGFMSRPFSFSTSLKGGQVGAS